jgi:hypothetical protein
VTNLPAQTYDTETARGFLLDRKDWFQVETVERGNDHWDVVLRIDGTYTGEIVATREDIVRYFTDWLKAVLRNEDG